MSYFISVKYKPSAAA